ncbi:MAG: ABC transporter ATP-binding protein [Azovibrio sp.]|nr:ABC transporter ATP-binding protein [Azovibrio sp.]
MALLQTRGLTRILNDGPQAVPLVQDIDLAVQAGEFVAITGPSGSGKSSLLYLLGLLDAPTAGELWIDGQNAARLSAAEQARLRLGKLGFVFQFHFLLPEFTLLQNVMIPMQKLGKLGAEAMRARATALLVELGLESGHDKRPDQLSGGQRQRVAIARALANDPLILLADEPTGNLDSKNGQIVFDIFQRLAARGQTVITVTHDAHLAAQTHRQIHLVDGRISG